MGLDGLLRYRGDAVSGILNGIDTGVWNPATDPLIESRYDASDPSARAANKAALQRQFGLAVDAKAPLFGVISRLTWQKGLDLLWTRCPPSSSPAGNSPCWARASRRWKRPSPRRRAPIPTGSASGSAMTRRWRTASRQASMRSSCPRGSSPAA